jgi:hypothetical protein
MSVISVEIRGLRRDAMSAAGFRHAFRSGLNLLVVSALATLAVLLGVTLTIDTVAGQHHACLRPHNSGLHPSGRCARRGAEPAGIHWRSR